MANLGILNASYYADTSISRLKRQVDVSVEKVSSNKAISVVILLLNSPTLFVEKKLIGEEIKCLYVSVLNSAKDFCVTIPKR